LPGLTKMPHNHLAKRKKEKVLAAIDLLLTAISL